MCPNSLNWKHSYLFIYFSCYRKPHLNQYPPSMPFCLIFNFKYNFQSSNCALLASTSKESMWRACGVYVNIGSSLWADSDYLYRRPTAFSPSQTFGAVPAISKLKLRSCFWISPFFIPSCVSAFTLERWHWLMDFPRQFLSFEVRVLMYLFRTSFGWFVNIFSCTITSK